MPQVYEPNMRQSRLFQHSLVQQANHRRRVWFQRSRVNEHDLTAWVLFVFFFQLHHSVCWQDNLSGLPTIADQFPALDNSVHVDRQDSALRVQITSFQRYKLPLSQAMLQGQKEYGQESQFRSRIQIFLYFSFG